MASGKGELANSMSVPFVPPDSSTLGPHQALGQIMKRALVLLM